MIFVEPGAGLCPALPLSRREMTAFMTRLLDALGLEGASVELRLVDDAAMARMNRDFLGLPGPTNVLSFPAEDDRDPACLGEIALSVDTLLRESHLYGQPPEEHLARLLAHGLLHLAGHDHGPVMDDLTDLAVEAMRGA